MLLTLYKKLHLYRDNQREGLWKERGMVRSLNGKTVLILGAGDIGGAFARLVRPLGASRIIGIKRSVSAKPDWLDEVYPLDQLDSLLPQADVVANVLPGAPETERLFDRRRLALLRPDAVLLNCGRGSAVDPDALCDALEHNPALCAGLDVTDPEPLPPEHHLWQMPNALITPHAAGNFHLDSILDLLLAIALKNFEAYLKTGQPVVNVIRWGKRP
jgi:phosphoglycerate dehydrogenase-like enzyme